MSQYALAKLRTVAQAKAYVDGVMDARIVVALALKDMPRVGTDLDTLLHKLEHDAWKRCTEIETQRKGMGGPLDGSKP